jgi:hypothetical protein
MTAPSNSPELDIDALDDAQALAACYWVARRRARIVREHTPPAPAAPPPEVKIAAWAFGSLEPTHDKTN